MNIYRGGRSQDGVKRKKKLLILMGKLRIKGGVYMGGKEQSKCVYVCVITVCDSCLNP